MGKEKKKSECLYKIAEGFDKIGIKSSPVRNPAGSRFGHIV